MAVTARTLKLQQQLRAEITKVTDSHTRELVAAWVTAWDEISPDLTAALLEQLIAGDRVTKAQLLRSTRLRKALAVIADHLETLAKDAGVLITGDLRGVIDTAGGAQASVIDSQLPPKSGLLDGMDAWSRVDARQIDAMVKRSTQQITSLTKPLAPEAYDAVRRELIRGVASGSNPRATAGRIVKRAEGKFNGGLNRALVIARTETLDAHRAAGALGMSQHGDVLKGWQWQAALDKRTCPSCWSQHGTVHDLKDPGPLDHQQGRCARLPVPMSWADLGFADIEEPASLLPDGADVFTNLSAADQLTILGPTRYAAYAVGDFPMGSWSVRKSTSGWRDSFHVAPAPQSGGRVSRNVA